MKRRNHSIGDDAGTKSARRCSGDSAVKDQLHLTGASDVDVLPDYFFKEDAPDNRPVST
jgi:hypothetical protein